MTEPTREVYDLLSEHTHASSMPIDVAEAAIHYGAEAHSPLNSQVYLKTIDGNELDDDSTIIGYRVMDNGAVLYPKNKKGAWACPVGRLEGVVELIVKNTGYIITEKRGRFSDE